MLYPKHSLTEQLIWLLVWFGKLSPAASSALSQRLAQIWSVDRSYRFIFRRAGRECHENREKMMRKVAPVNQYTDPFVSVFHLTMTYRSVLQLDPADISSCKWAQESLCIKSSEGLHQSDLSHLSQSLNNTLIFTWVTENSSRFIPYYMGLHNWINHTFAPLK